MNTFWPIYAGVVLAFCGAARAADTTSAALDACLKRGGAASTADASECYASALGAYDRRLNAAYGRLLKALPTAPANLLRASQRQWLSFRDSELATQASLFETLQGTMYVPMQEEEQVSLTRDRALHLEGYLRALSIAPR